MIDLTTPNEWQHKDESLGGILFPWYTKSFLDELVTWDLKGKVILEIGGGASTLWWTKKANSVYLIDDNHEYWDDLFSRNIPNLYSAKDCPNGPFDIVIVDSDPVENRDRLCRKALRVIKPGGKLIVDNWLQPSVWMASEETQKLLADYPCKIYKQEGHPDWSTAVFDICKHEWDYMTTGLWVCSKCKHLIDHEPVN